MSLGAHNLPVWSNISGHPVVYISGHTRCPEEGPHVDMVPVIPNYGGGRTLCRYALLLQEGGLRGTMHLSDRYAA